MFNKNEKILNDVIKPKEEMIKELAIDNKSLKKELEINPVPLKVYNAEFHDLLQR